MEFYLRHPTWGRDRKALLALAAQGVDVPSLRSEPVIIPPDIWLWDGYQILSAKRMYNEYHPQPIQVSEIKAYCDFHRIDEEVRRGLFFHVVTQLDSTFMAHHWEQVVKANK